MSDAINHLINCDLELFKQAIHQSLYSRVGTAFQEKKKELSTELFNEEECASCGEQIEEKKDFAALAPPYDKPTYADKIAGAKLSAKKKGKK
jgi:hypothetical protein